MKNYCALVSGGVVAEIIVASLEWASSNLPGEWHDLGPEPLTVAIGWIWDGTTFNPPPVVEPI